MISSEWMCQSLCKYYVYKHYANIIMHVLWHFIWKTWVTTDFGSREGVLEPFPCEYWRMTVMCWPLICISGLQIYGVVGITYREGSGAPLQYFCLGNPRDRGAWWAAVHGVAKSRTRLSYFTLTFHFHALEKEMATHSSILAWRIPGTGEPGGLTFMGSRRVRYDWSELAAAVKDRQSFLKMN